MSKINQDSWFDFLSFVARVEVKCIDGSRNMCTLCHNSLICIRTHKAHATRWPSSGQRPSSHLPLSFKKAHHEHALHFTTSWLPDHLYISQQILFNRGTHASVQQGPLWCCAFTLRREIFVVTSFYRSMEGWCRIPLVPSINHFFVNPNQFF